VRPVHPATVGQRGLWFEQQADPASNAYNLGACLRFPGEIDAARLEAAIDAVARRHPLMRARFRLDGAEPSWTASASPPPLTRVEGADEEAIARIEALLLAPYALDRESPWRFAIAPAAGATFVGLGCHHIVSDLHSMVLAVKDLDAAYAGREPGPAPTAYEDYARW
jgi:hypothetical protein